MFDELDLDRITDAYARGVIGQLLNAVEALVAANRALQAENQQLRAEIQRLKGEQGPPRIPGNTRRPAPADYSSEGERHVPQTWTKRPKRPHLRIDREQVLEVEPATLPADAQFKGYASVVVQDVVLRSDTICFHKAKWYSPCTGRPTWLPCRRATRGPSAPASKRSRWPGTSQGR